MTVEGRAGEEGRWERADKKERIEGLSHIPTK